ncbi:25795_t:CDS:2 [Dentiscutata erythropus]|uniref:25795_t:CDS:1 n=1 Tax=Dentiscutata erythropus TaxID=1348616 RepID=A0A9N9NSY2_9GLOM|nr:25795_t:CDS:2 [Dentiscutata erythropus]
MDETVLAYDAKYFLAIHFLNGHGIDKNLNEAYKLFGELNLIQDIKTLF